MTAGKVQINPKLSPTLFRPDVPVGTSITDTTPDGRGELFIAEVDLKKADNLLKKIDKELKEP